MSRSFQALAALAVAVPLLLADAPDALAEKAPTGKQVMERLENRDDGRDETSSHALAIIPKQGSKRFRKYTLMRKEYDDVTKLVTFFSAPTDVRGAAFMAWDKKNAPDQRWIYLPAISQVRRLVAGDERQSFFGSDFVYEDLTNRDPEQDTHKLVGAQKVDKWECWVVDSTPKNKRGLDFARYRSWVSKDGYILVRQEFFDSSGKVTRRLQAKSIVKIKGIQTYRQIIAQNLKTGSESRLQVSGTQYNAGLADERFTEAQLKRGAPK